MTTSRHANANAAQTTIPFGWNLLIDQDTPILGRLVIQGNVTFDPAANVTLRATYIVVMKRGSLTAGSPAAPFTGRATISLAGRRDTPDWPSWAIDNDLNLGSKVLAAIDGGVIDLHGAPVTRRWTKLSSAVAAGATTLTVSGVGLMWRKGNRVLVTSTSFNTWQAEIRTLTQATESAGITTLTLNGSLLHPHGSLIKAHPGGPTVDMRAEVAYLSSNILITATDGDTTKALGISEYFGARVVVSGNATGRFSHIAMEYCGQGGLANRACMFYDRLEKINGSANPSFLRNSAMLWGMNANLRVGGLPGTHEPVDITGNVMYEGYDENSVEIQTRCVPGGLGGPCGGTGA